MKVVTAEEMREIDRKTIASGVPSIELMENAGRVVAKAIKSRYTPLKDKKVSIFCGKGNNGGDGLVVARLLAKERAKIRAFLLARKEELKKDPKTNLRKALRQEIKVIEIDTFRKLKKFEREIKNSNIR